VCELAHVQFDGTNDTFPSTACDGLSQTFPSLSALDGSTLLLAIAGADAVLSIDSTSNTLKQLAPLPQPYNSSDPFIGLVVVSGNAYLVTQFHLYQVRGCAYSLSMPF
jgi:hypothetical protein